MVWSKTEPWWCVHEFFTKPEYKGAEERLPDAEGKKPTGDTKTKRGGVMGLFSDLFKKMSNARKSVFQTQKEIAAEAQRKAALAKRESGKDVDPNCPFTQDI